MNVDLKRLRLGEQLAGAGAVLLFVALFFFKWYGAGPFAVDGWHGHSVLRWFMLLTILAVVALVFLTATRATVALPVTAAVITTTIAGLTTILVGYRVLLNEPGPNALIDLKFGAYLGLIALIITTVGAWKSLADEDTTMADPHVRERTVGTPPPAAS